MILLSFDIEEFDVPLEYGATISFEEQISISKQGTNIILDILKEYKIKATFFCTVLFARNSLDIIERIKNEGHEIASHGFSHSKFHKDDIQKSKVILEEITGMKIYGFRMSRMQETNLNDLILSGYLYDSSTNPTYIPGRYNNLSKPRLHFSKGEIIYIPTTVTRYLRIPLFWLSFRNINFSIYMWLTLTTLKKDKYINIYLHPWEFTELRKSQYPLPFYITNNSGKKLIIRFKKYIEKLIAEKKTFITISEFVHQLK